MIVSMPVRDVLIIWAGPSGLATAIAAKQHGLDYLVVEKGLLVNSIFRVPINISSSRHRSCSKSGGSRS
jgi:thioredoxin reductase (NADPH)